MLLRHLCRTAYAQVGALVVEGSRSRAGELVSRDDVDTTREPLRVEAGNILQRERQWHRVRLSGPSQQPWVEDG